MGLSRSRFSRDRRSVSPSLGQQRGAFHQVYNETQLQQAITNAAQNAKEISTGVFLGFAGYRIVIAEPIKFTKTLTIPFRVFGLTIEAASLGTYIWADTDIGAFFEVRGNSTTIRGIREASTGGTVNAFATTTSTAAADGLAVDLTIEGCDVASTYLFLRPTATVGGLTDAVFRSNRGDRAIDIDNATACQFFGNHLGAVTIRGGSDNIFIGNKGMTLDTSAATTNTCYGNTSGTYTLDATDKPATATDHNT